MVVGGTYFANAQTFVQVLHPTSIVASYDHTISDWALSPDMTVPANRVIAPVVMARDNSAGDSLLCNSTTQNLAGKIALIYRGECEFGTKAANAFNAGAAAIIIVGNVTGELINMAAGSQNQGDVVSVATVFLKKEDGDIIASRLRASDSVSVLIGNKNGYYVNDLGSVPGYTANVPAQVPVEIAANTTQFPIVYAAQLYNYGSATQTNITVNAELFKDGNSIHSSLSNSLASLVAGDSSDQFTFTNYSGNLGTGDYLIKYTFQSDSIDQTASDNVFEYPFRINDDKLFSYAKYNADSSFTYYTGLYGPSERSGAFSACMMFKNANANNLGIKGVYFNASMGDDLAIDGEEVLVQVFKWEDAVDRAAGTVSFTALTDVTAGSFTYEVDDQYAFQYVPMDDYVLLENNARYLVCVKGYNDLMYFGYDNVTKYDYYTSIANEFISPIADGTTWYAAGFNGGPVPSTTIEFFTAEEVGLANADKLVDAVVYPNPATDVVNVVVSNYEGEASVFVTDLAGKVVMTSNVTIVANKAISFATADLTAGMYLVNVKLANGSEVKSSVIVE